MVFEVKKDNNKDPFDLIMEQLEKYDEGVPPIKIQGLNCACGTEEGKKDDA